MVRKCRWGSRERTGKGGGGVSVSFLFVYIQGENSLPEGLWGFSSPSQYVNPCENPFNEYQGVSFRGLVGKRCCGQIGSFGEGLEKAYVRWIAQEADAGVRGVTDLCVCVGGVCPWKIRGGKQE